MLNRSLVPGFSQDGLTTVPLLPSEGLPAASCIPGTGLVCSGLRGRNHSQRCPPLCHHPTPTCQLPAQWGTARSMGDRYRLRFGPSLGQRGAFQAAAWGRSFSRSSMQFGTMAKAHTLPWRASEDGGGSTPPPALPAASGNKIPSPVDSAAARFR